MIKIEITFASEEDYRAALVVLEEAEMNGEFNDAFSVQRKENDHD